MNIRKLALYSTFLSVSFCAGSVFAATTKAPSGPVKASVHKAPAKAAPVKAVAPARRVAKARNAPFVAGGEEGVIVTGTHATNRHARQSTSPITVLSSATLRRSGMMNLADALAKTYPSINMSTMGNDAGALTSFIRMRGLNPNQVLVLVDGKRRHTTANINADAGPNFGATPVDLNMIPSNMIDHIEVLEDGAAAMYGSDAIAGVVNIITKKQDHGLNMSAQTGANAYNGDGWQYQLNADGGLKLGNDGFIHISGQVYHTDHFVTNTVDNRLAGYVPAGAANELYTGSVKVPKNSNKIMSTPEETRENLGIDFGKNLTENIQFYGQITYAHRHAEAYENYRVPSGASASNPELFPYGYSPLETIDENDYAATLGLKGGHFFGFDWDLSSTWGEDLDKISNKNTTNPNMYAATGYTPTTVRTSNFRLAQWTNNLDFRRNFKIANVVPMTVAFGGEHRLEQYTIMAGDPASYEYGGTSALAGLTPQDAGKWNRDVWAAYLDGDFHLLKNWDLDFAGRFEHYTDVGNTENGKVSTRYDITKRIGLRATISNGFRAPTMAEQHYSAINVGPTSVLGLLPVSSSEARATGASPLKPERSTSATGGIVLEPIDGFHIETDVYQINIRDRIVQGGNVTGATAISALEAMGVSLPALTQLSENAVQTYYFTNGASTRTQGLDIKADYMFRMHRYGNLSLSMALDLNRTRLTHNGMSATGSPLLNAQNIAYLTTAYPRSKIILNAFWTIGKWDVNVRQTRYGETTDMMTYQDWTPTASICPIDGKQLQQSSSCFAQFKNSPRWLTDLEIGYRVNSRWHLAVGANNIFNVRPRKLPGELNQLGGNPYDTFSSQVPMTGGYYYGRVNFTL
ncbi:TonB-dependent siderophore receptor [Gluconobacter oxydans]|uniref:TonB-dependent receptor plug domain-containing protein n=1 Tax=Gluconobacter oxydans TaxID=442 RepID=UPI001CD8C324|nr:TonB-dependent receptor [Gluconobacter oxydans]